MLALLAVATAAAQTGRSGALAIDLRDPRAQVSQNIDDGLLLRLVSQGDHEWEVQVVARPPGEFPENLLYHSTQWHGPYPTQIFAWHVATGRFPHERLLCVRGRPYELAVRLKDVQTQGTGADAHFVRGAVEVEWFQRPCTRGFGY